MLHLVSQGPVVRAHFAEITSLRNHAECVRDRGAQPQPVIESHERLSAWPCNSAGPPVSPLISRHWRYRLCRARDLGVHASIVEGARGDRHDDRAGLGAAWARTGEVVALAGCDGAD